MENLPNLIPGTVVSPLGFQAAGAHTGVKKSKKDLCLIKSGAPAVAAGVYTTNIVKAAPVLWDMAVTNSGKKVSGIVVNSGNANACTGAQGKKDCADMAACFAESLGCSSEEVLVCSTGVIGVTLPMDTVIKGIQATGGVLGESENHGILAAEAIMTTDTFKKHAAVQIEIGGKSITLGGMAKGSGMIHPNMATMLAFITTDAAISPELLDKALKDCVQDSFNMISVDGDTSTNDTVLILANGMAGNLEIKEESPDYQIFKGALLKLCIKLAVDVAKDGEGATKLLEVQVTGAKTVDDARTIARSVTSSNLFKAALFGADANWGRVLCAMGYSGGDFDPEKVTIIFRSGEPHGQNAIMLMDAGVPIVFDEDTAAAILKEDKIYVDIQLAQGNCMATAWGCDLTYDYVKINGDYRS